MKRLMTAADIRDARRFNSPWEVLMLVVADGREYPDAVFAVSQALRMNKEEVAQMERDYDEIC